MNEPILLRARLAAPIAEVWRALTDAEALRAWLAEHAEVELPHRYGFWGRHTPDGDAAHQRLLHADEHTLRFAWSLGGVHTTVEIGLEPEAPGSTVLTLTQTDLPGFADMVAESGPLSQVYTYWALAIANLADYLEGRELTPKCDFTSPVMRERLFIGAPPKVVYDSIVDPETFARWFGAKIEIEPHVGGRWAMGGFDGNPAPARLIELEPGRAMAIAWDDGMVTSWELAESGGGTQLTFVQSGFDERRPPYASWLGWLGGMAELRRFHELRDWRPLWIEVRVPGTPDGLVTITRDTDTPEV